MGIHKILQTAKKNGWVVAKDELWCETMRHVYLTQDGNLSTLPAISFLFEKRGCWQLTSCDYHDLDNKDVPLF